MRHSRKYLWKCQVRIMKNILTIIKKLDNFSKVILSLLLLGGLFYLYQNFVPGNKFSAPSNTVKLRNPSSFKLNVSDYSFGSGFKERLLIDDLLVISLNRDLDQETFNKLVFEINPKDDIKVEYVDSRTIKIYFKNKMQLNNNVNTFLVLLNDELVYSIVFSNTTYDQDYFDQLNQIKVQAE